MSEDWLVRSPTPADFDVVVAALQEAVPDLLIRGDHTRTALVVVDATDRPLVWVLDARPVDTPVQAAVALGLPTADPDLRFWTELTAPTDRPLPGGGTAYDLLERVAQALARATQGSAVRWSGGPRPVEPEVPEPAPTPGDEPDHPADVVTDSCALWFASRPVIGLTAWLLFVQRWAQERDLQCVVLTPMGTQLSPAAAEFMDVTGSMWVVDTGTELFDGLRGQNVRLETDGMAATGEINPAFHPSDDDDWALYVEAETTHPYSDDLQLGAFAQAVVNAAGLGPLTALGVVEPMEVPWELEVISEYARQVSPGESRLLAAGPATSAVLTATPQPIGVVERVVASTLPVPEPVAKPAIDAFVDQVLRTGAQAAVLSYRRTTLDGRVPSRLCGPTVPLAIVIRRDRFPTLQDGQALRLAGPTGRLVDNPARALVVTFDLDAEPGEGERHPAQVLTEMLVRLEHHDAHVQAQRTGEAPDWQ